MDVFQGWFKDRTEGTVDYRFLSAFFLILRFAQGGKLMFVITLLDDKKERLLMRAILVGIFQVSMGVLFFMLKPYKKLWMSSVDGIIFTLVGCYILVETFNNHMLNIFVIVLTVVFTILCVVYNIYNSH